MECKAGREGPHGPQCLEDAPLPGVTSCTFSCTSWHPDCPYRIMEMHRLNRIDRLPCMISQALAEFWDHAIPMDYHDHVKPLHHCMWFFRDTFWPFMRGLVKMRPHLLSPLLHTFFVAHRRGEIAEPLFEIVPEDFHYALLREAHEGHSTRLWKREDFGELTDEMQRHLLPLFVAGPVLDEFQAVRTSMHNNLDRDTARLVTQFVSLGYTALHDKRDKRRRGETDELRRVRRRVLESFD